MKLAISCILVFWTLGCATQARLENSKYALMQSYTAVLETAIDLREDGVIGDDAWMKIKQVDASIDLYDNASFEFLDHMAKALTTILEVIDDERDADNALVHPNREGD